MISIGKVLGTFSAKKDLQSSPRPRVKSLNLITGYGIAFDKFAGKELDKTVMIVGIKAYEIAKENGIDLVYGSLGENILLDFDPHKYKIGDVFYINSCAIQITESCTVCKHLSKFDNKLPKLLKDNRGLYCKILSDGEIKEQMQVEIKKDK
ncbi:MOSC domain-containing protein [Malaciobacter halophilus]|uniref:MOSC domain-containing protein n=1 Tax=Malaciobacter halophilus TaxID=197482 RepID=A0A2N1J2B7_9BACT|nr:MOSC domain-containing protein [Malaciobacter halophilus]AXH09031.1 MOSC domain-containing protein [Malaciobacter halophilus]PKI80699.1 MOSC domain-containing protein [Malaciobacter halophilus]